MTVRDILRWPDPALASICAPVGEVTEATERLAANLLDTMYDAPGRGLAAPQIGVLARMFVMDVAWKTGSPEPLVFIDPEILELGDKIVTQDEGCLSIPDVSVPVSRPDTVVMIWTDLARARVSARFTGFAAACVQHELDHLNGVVTLDHLNEEARARVLKHYGEALA